MNSEIEAEVFTVDGEGQGTGVNQRSRQNGEVGGQGFVRDTFPGRDGFIFQVDTFDHGSTKSGVDLWQEVDQGGGVAQLQGQAVRVVQVDEIADRQTIVLDFNGTAVAGTWDCCYSQSSVPICIGHTSGKGNLFETKVSPVIVVNQIENNLVVLFGKIGNMTRVEASLP